MPAASDSGSVIEKFQRDVLGNSLAVVVLVGMIVVVIWAVRRIWRRPVSAFLQIPSRGYARSLAALCLVGLVVSVYMAHVEMTDTAAVCGAIGDCNTVQQSPYAMLFGVVPIGVLGVVGYGAILVALAGLYLGQERVKRLLLTALWLMALFGTLYSIYLTFLEPFVIGATCAWCLTSAVSMALILFVLARSLSTRADQARQAARA